ncbi:RING-H2 finger protein ATL39-like [Lycium ferocissimum]|uniref:RING-H2 finger protein ATL39-like n=1 Tax=Lycium ferocissimum TaxID=112874 RepID=UPI0028164042|nr:RING-H2 finger protein ATL39-like [Lycium ferocissimum]
MDEAQWGFLAQVIAVFAFVLIVYLCHMCIRRISLSSNNVLPTSHQAPPLPPPPELEDNFKIMVFNEGSLRGKSSINGENDCAICLLEFLKGDSYVVLPACCHKFHADCVMIWLAINRDKTCPICRTHVNIHA